MTKMEVEQLSTSAESLATSFGENRRIQKVGKMMVEEAVAGNSNAPRIRRLREKFSNMGINSKEDLHKLSEGTRMQEDLQFGNNSVLYTTAVASFIEKELRAELVSEEIIKSTQVNAPNDSIKIPKGTNKTAAAVSADGTVTLDSNDYGKLTINTDLYGVRDQIQLELMQVTSIDLMADQFEELGRALALKRDDDIQSELQDVTDPTGTYGDNTNYNYLGGAATITYDDLVAGIHSAKGNKMNPTDIVAGTGILSSLEQDNEFSNAAQFASTPAGDFVPQTMTFRGLNVLESANVASDSLFIVDRNRLGWFVEGSDGVQTFDARVNDKVAFEVLAVERHGVGIARPQSVYGIHQKEATPT